MSEFNYHRPTTLGEAAALHQGAEDAVYLSGGQTLLPAINQRLAAPTDLIDLQAVAGLAGIRVAGANVHIGAFVRHAEVAAFADVRRAIPALAALAGGIGDPQVRNRGTIGGSLANSDPAADYPAAVLALNASIHTDQRQIAGDEYFLGLFETALAPAEIITGVSFAAPTRAAYRKFPNPASRYAVVGVMVADHEGAIRVGVTGAGPCAFRAYGYEQALAASFHPAALDEMEAIRGGGAAPSLTKGASAADFNSDLHASASIAPTW